MTKTEEIPDQDAMREMGEAVRQRLDNDPGVYKIDTDMADVYAVGDFLTPAECERLCAMVDETARPSSLHEIGYESGFRTS